MEKTSKTHKAASKRLKVTGGGKVRHFRMGVGHLMTSKNAKRRRRLNQPAISTGRKAKKYTTFIR
ncbi:MAG TPA: 50S ribosomal protein L35 [Planctomycetes bacterium]|nr:50S ribosomal protein L35 [Planctomycetota bacterium]